MKVEIEIIIEADSSNFNRGELYSDILNSFPEITGYDIQLINIVPIK